MNESYQKISINKKDQILTLSSEYEKIKSKNFEMGNKLNLYTNKNTNITMMKQFDVKEQKELENQVECLKNEYEALLVKVW